MKGEYKQEGLEDRKSRLGSGCWWEKWKRGRRSSKREGGKSSGASAIYRRLVLTQDHPHPPGASCKDRTGPFLLFALGYVVRYHTALECSVGFYFSLINTFVSCSLLGIWFLCHPVADARLANWLAARIPPDGRQKRDEMRDTPFSSLQDNSLRIAVITVILLLAAKTRLFHLSRWFDGDASPERPEIAHPICQPNLRTAQHDQLTLYSLL